jgi:hypothetical protein
LDSGTSIEPLLYGLFENPNAIHLIKQTMEIYQYLNIVHINLYNEFQYY